MRASLRHRRIEVAFRAKALVASVIPQMTADPWCNVNPAVNGCIWRALALPRKTSHLSLSASSALARPQLREAAELGAPCPHSSHPLRTNPFSAGDAIHGYYISCCKS